MSGRAAIAEFSRIIDIESTPKDGAHFDITADGNERKALARRLGIIAVERLEAALDLCPLGAGATVAVTGRFAADIVQACVVSLEPVRSHVAAPIALRFAPPAGPTREVVVEPEGEDPPDPLIDGAIDLGEAVAEQLAMAIDPYPRLEKAEIDNRWYEAPPLDTDSDNLESAGGPFAALRGKLAG